MMLLSTCSECEGGRSARREEEGQVRGEMTEVQHLKRERGRGGMRRAKGRERALFPIHVQLRANGWGVYGLVCG
jgi:hypothetical protein